MCLEDWFGGPAEVQISVIDLQSSEEVLQTSKIVANSFSNLFWGFFLPFRPRDATFSQLYTDWGEIITINLITLVLSNKLT